MVSTIPSVWYKQRILFEGGSPDMLMEALEAGTGAAALLSGCPGRPISFCYFNLYACCHVPLRGRDDAPGSRLKDANGTCRPTAADVSAPSSTKVRPIDGDPIGKIDGLAPSPGVA